MEQNRHALWHSGVGDHRLDVDLADCGVVNRSFDTGVLLGARCIERIPIISLPRCGSRAGTKSARGKVPHNVGV